MRQYLKDLNAYADRLVRAESIDRQLALEGVVLLDPVYLPYGSRRHQPPHPVYRRFGSRR